MIETELAQTTPNIILVTFSGLVSLEEISSDRQFGIIIKRLAGAPFGVICDFTSTTTMSEGVGAVFMNAQRFAVDQGMRADAFVSSSAVLQLQFSRIARESGRSETLGRLRFFDNRAKAYQHLTCVLSPPPTSTAR